MVGLLTGKRGSSTVTVHLPQRRRSSVTGMTRLTAFRPLLDGGVASSRGSRTVVTTRCHLVRGGDIMVRSSPNAVRVPASPRAGAAAIVRVRCRGEALQSRPVGIDHVDVPAVIALGHGEGEPPADRRPAE